jgi:hypothetical protein
MSAVERLGLTLKKTKVIGLNLFRNFGIEIMT